MVVCLVRKLANCLDGVDVSPYGVGDIVDFPERQARLLLAEGWAVVDRRRESLPLTGGERRVERTLSRAPEEWATTADTSTRPAQDESVPNLHYDDCEEREARVATTLNQHRAERQTKRPPER
jgi:hypothetical protein